MDTLLLHFDDETVEAERLARAAGVERAVIERHRFPDDELHLRLPQALPRQVVVYRSLHRPNEKLLELLLVVRTAGRLGAEHLTLVAPYLAYMRQDVEFTPGEAVSQGIVGEFLAGLFDAVLTVDPHLHRVASLAEAVPVPHAVALSGAPLLADIVAAQRPGALLVGPDAESAQWVQAAAASHGLDHAVCSKVRHGDCEVEIALPEGLDVAGRNVVLLDDVASSGHTLAQAARGLRAAGAASVDVAVTHAVFAGGALALLRDAGVDQIWSTDCITHPSNAVCVAPRLAEALHTIHAS
ncbi:ribose-phosphate diphosphokinase [Thauera linaloolentis]|uniref:Phosphoribosylpyrophosphate synthetase n=1 Tax=Thauera linaloolentis (strain DSM 12138 / JCM 21573 / CCUG 41526 / CIP 105981 / IAM 15112 / NBRC 102519 / 47Lol) TaxID=1123367 RepID=N6Z917_THAL4|nr:ribose-phosphate diphosphokinase [Thauera linaloolentis]ENO88659.1 phosphoribosylpyrophosphate synthetase [Thauera linaloolentis 47Lol = DSM 12138]MCM8565704.1 ribose-phosphate diphosphokinase [Thauera linaloolentis]